MVQESLGSGCQAGAAQLIDQHALYMKGMEKRKYRVAQVIVIEERSWTHKQFQKFGKLLL